MALHFERWVWQDFFVGSVNYFELLSFAIKDAFIGRAARTVQSVVAADEVAEEAKFIKNLEDDDSVCVLEGLSN